MRPYFDPDYDNFSQWINPPRVCVDNTSFSDCTIVKVDSVNKPGILLEVVQVLSDLDLAISKAYITSDGTWFMDVFHVTDQQGRKITEKKTIDYIEKALGPESIKAGSWPGKSVGMHSFGNHIAIELIGTDRPGLLSEIFAVLANQHCNVVAAEVWTHKTRVACVIYINDEATSEPMDDPNRLMTMEEQLRNVLRGGDDVKGSRTNFSISSTHVDRRLHQLMLADKDYESDGGIIEEKDDVLFRPIITIDHCEDKGYSVVNIKCKDRSKLLFDIVCTLTDMHFVVSHASVSSDGPFGIQVHESCSQFELFGDLVHAYNVLTSFSIAPLDGQNLACVLQFMPRHVNSAFFQRLNISISCPLEELYFRHKDGKTLDSIEEKEEVIKCLEAAILRRVSEGFSLEICAKDRVGLLSDVTRVLREYGLSVSRADVTTIGEKAINVFYVRDPSGNPVDMKTIEALRKEIGHTVMLNVKKFPSTTKSPEASGWAKNSFSFGNLFGKFLG